jgi:hypothetical protein
MRHRPVARGCLSAQDQGQLPELGRRQYKTAPNYHIHIQQRDVVELSKAELRDTKYNVLHNYGDISF